MYHSSVFVWWQSRKDVFSCGKAACTEAVAALPQQKSEDKYTLIQI
jgi:hypothetical protein